MKAPIYVVAAATLIPTFLALGGCDNSFGAETSCAEFEGQLASAPGLSWAGARERCGASSDSYAYLADGRTILVHLKPSTRDDELRRALTDTTLEISLPGGVEVGDVINLPHGRLTELGPKGFAVATAVVTGGRVQVDRVARTDGIVSDLSLTWDLTFGDPDSQGTWLKARGSDAFVVSDAFCDPR